MKTAETMSFSDRIKWRIRTLWVLFTAMFCSIVILGERSLGNARLIARFADTCGALMFLCMVAWIVWRLRYNTQLLRNPRLLRQQELDEEAQRMQDFHRKTGMILWDILFVGLYFITLTTSLWNMQVFYVSFAVFAVAIAARVLIWHRHCRQCA